MYSSVDEVKSRLDIVDFVQGYIRLYKAGRNYKACCPFHNEKTPSMIVSPEKQIWHCFGCGKGGSIFDFIMEMDGVEFGDALRILARRAGVELKDSKEYSNSTELRTERSRLYEICDLAVRFFEKQLESKQGKVIYNYLQKRGLQSSTIKEWRIGYAPVPPVGEWCSLYNFLSKSGYANDDILKTGLIIKNDSASVQNRYYDRFRDRIIFPISDLNGQIVGFTGRENPNNLNDRMGKYVNIPNTLIFDKSKILYGLDKAKIDIRTKESCILVEGQMDVIMAHQADSKNVLACSGTALTEQHLKTIKRYTNKLVMAFDTDFAGENATKRGIDSAIQMGFDVKIANLPNGKDPADCILEDISAWVGGIENSKKIIEFYINTAFERNDPKNIDGKKQIANDVLPIIKKIPNSVEQSYWLQDLSNRINIDENALLGEMNKVRDNTITRYNENSESNNQSRQVPNTEEYTLGLILSDLHNIDRIRDNFYSELFINSDFKEIFEQLIKKNPKSLDKFKVVLTSPLVNKIDHLILAAEYYKDKFDNDDNNISNELDFCLAQLKSRYFYNKKLEFNLAIKKAEQSQDSVLVNKLTIELNNFLKKDQ